MQHNSYIYIFRHRLSTYSLYSRIHIFTYSRVHIFTYSRIHCIHYIDWNIHTYHTPVPWKSAIIFIRCGLTFPMTIFSSTSPSSQQMSYVEFSSILLVLVSVLVRTYEITPGYLYQCFSVSVYQCISVSVDSLMQGMVEDVGVRVNGMGQNMGQHI